MPNRFYVEPGNKYGAGLSGLAGLINDATAKKEEEAKRTAESERITKQKKEAMEAYNTKDPEKIRQFMIGNPEIAPSIKQAMEMKFPGESGNSYKNALFSAATDFTKAPQLLQEMRIQFEKDGLDPQEIAKLDDFQNKLDTDPEQAKKDIESDFATIADNDMWKRYHDMKVTPEKDASTADIKEYKFAKEQGYEGSFIEYKNKFGVSGAKTYSPSPLKKLMDERQALVDTGLDLNDPKVKAYDSKITGVDIDMEDMSKDEVDTFGAYFNATGKLPSLGRGKQSTKIRMAIAKSAARQALGADIDGVPDGTPSQTPSDAAFSMISSQADTKAIQGSLNFLDKQVSSMGSFVTNLNSQVDKVGELAKDLKTFDASLMNKPLRYVRGKLKGSDLQAKYDMYLAEIESEIGKLATGSTGSVAELSASAQEKWATIHDKNLSVTKMLSLLEETKAAANFRLESVQGQLDKTRSRMKNRDQVPNTGQPTQTGKIKFLGFE